MALSTVIKSMLKANTDLTAVVPESNMFAVTAAQESLFPSIVYKLKGMDPSDVKMGVSKKDTYVYDIYSISKNFDQAHEIDSLIRNAIDGTKGTFDGHIINHVHFLGMEPEEFDHDRAKAYIVTSQYKFRHTPA